MFSKYLVYGLIDPSSKLIRYVGQSTRGLDRPRSHRWRTQENDKTHRANWLRSVWNIGLDYEIVVLQECTILEELDEAERWWIALGRLSGWDLTNFTDGGGGIRGYRHTVETRARLSEVSKSAWQREGYRERWIAKRVGHPRSLETRQKISKSKMGHVQSPESRARMSAALVGKPGRKQSAGERLRRSVPKRNPFIRINLFPRTS